MVPSGRSPPSNYIHCIAARKLYSQCWNRSRAGFRKPCMEVLAAQFTSECIPRTCSVAAPFVRDEGVAKVLGIGFQERRFPTFSKAQWRTKRAAQRNWRHRTNVSSPAHGRLNAKGAFQSRRLGRFPRQLIFRQSIARIVHSYSMWQIWPHFQSTRLCISGRAPRANEGTRIPAAPSWMNRRATAHDAGSVPLLRSYSHAHARSAGSTPIDLLSSSVLRSTTSSTSTS